MHKAKGLSSLSILPNRVDEDAVVRILRENLDNFESFYGEERKNVGSITWIVDPNLPEGYNAAAVHGVAPSGKTVREIHIRRSPAIAQDAKTLAHEIMHLVRYDAGHALDIGVYNEAHRFPLAARLASMLEDPLVDKILQEKYEFDLLSGYKKQLRLFKRQLRGFKQEPIDPLEKARLMIGFTEMTLEWNLIKDGIALKEFYDYQSTFRAKFPNISRMGDDLISTVQAIGLETPEKHIKIFNYIVEKYGLQNVVYLR